ncbi:hypothetical protein Pcinc_028727 [Petrolisthes cinctipes]|uniref:Reverse transcriptase n=1 Tax=Petrolisthes cinctipes TaxID=88211 RepID=A0AAE1F2B8_PETCI|nr:hypothetical protein Pcinc_028727 [Petrolisthes cinctipes]
MISDVLYENVEKYQVRVSEPHDEDNLGRWERMLKDKDGTRVWRAIDWRGEYDCPEKSEQCPSDEDFRKHFEAVLNPPNVVDLSRVDVTTITTVPVLDEPISPDQVCDQVRKLKMDKACGPDGLTPGVLSLLTAQWILVLTTLFNNVYLSGVYPEPWKRAKLFTIFKRGDKSVTDNYTNNYLGISVMNSLAKLYDMVLWGRLNHGVVQTVPRAGRCTE